jgi:uncharacterized protein (TIGR01777 family)
MKIILAGCTGFIGQALIQALLSNGHSLWLLTRSPEKASREWGDQVKFLKWDAGSSGDWMREFDGADAVINLTGESIAGKKWTAEQKKKIVASRVDSTKVIAEAILKSKNKPAVFINASAVGYYGNVNSGDVTEDTIPTEKSFLADTCTQWENEAKRADVEGVRVIRLRIGIVLEKNGGALAKMIPPFKFFIGGPLGSGKQWMPWIHRDDIIGLIQFVLAHEEVSGAVNATAPHPVTMKEFCQKLGAALHRPCWAPVPAVALKILLGEMAEMLLGGQKAVPKKLLQAGYAFKYPHLEDALREII